MRYMNRLGFQPLLFAFVPNHSYIIPSRFVKGSDMTVQPKDVGPAAGFRRFIESDAMPKYLPIVLQAISRPILCQIHCTRIIIIMKHVTTAAFNPRLNMIVGHDEEAGSFYFTDLIEVLHNPPVEGKCCFK